MPAEERSIRDRLAEALWRTTFSHRPDLQAEARWSAVDDHWKVSAWRLQADALLSALSSITDPSTGLKLTIGWGG